MNKVIATNYGGSNKTYYIKLKDKEELHRTYGGKIDLSDFGVSAGIVVNKIVRDMAFDKFCAANINNTKRKQVTNV